MNIKKISSYKGKTQSPKPKKVSDSEFATLDTLLEAGVNAVSIVRELDQYLSSDMKRDFIAHYKNMYNITDATIESPVFTEYMIEGQKDKIDKYKDNLIEFSNEELISPADVVIAIDDFISDYKRLALIDDIKNDLDIAGDFRSLHSIARQAGYDKVLESSMKSSHLDDTLKEIVVVTLMKEKMEDINDSVEGIKEPANLNERAEKVEKYTSDLMGLLEDNVCDAETLIKMVDETCDDKITTIQNKISVDLNQPESLDSTILDYIKNQGIEDKTQICKIIQEVLPEEDKLIVVDTILD